MAALQRRAHHVHVADALEREVHAAIGQFDDDVLDGLVVVLGVDAVGGAHGAGQHELVRVGVHGDDAAGLGLHRALDHRQADAAQAEHGDGIAFLDLGGVVHGAQAGGDATAQQADFFMRGGGVDLGQRDLVDDRVFAEGRAAHVVIERLAFVAEARGAVGHHTLALGGAHLLAQVGLAGQAELALAAFGRVERNDVVAGLERGHAFAHFDHHARAFMAQHGGEQAFGIVAAQREGVGVTDAGVRDLHQHFAALRRRDVDFNDFQRLAGSECDCCA
ncbi:hypothetical protein D3C78_1198970 [compost metagenome]